MTGERLDLTWITPGPVASRFMASAADVQIVNGPIGSGKTTTALMKAIRLARRQRTSSRDTTLDDTGVRVPVRKFRMCVVRDTYRQLWKTTLPSWFKRVPREVGEFTGAENAPATHRVAFKLGDGSIAEMIIEFVAIGENAVEDVLRGYEVTAFYLNEADLLAQEVFNFARGRTGRYPDMEEGGPTWHGILMDCNAPEFSSWLYTGIFTKSPEELEALGVALFIQPGGFDPRAENLKNLPPGYYPNQARGQPDWYLQRMIHNRPGYSRAGKPVYPEFNDTLHVAGQRLAFDPGLALHVGLDAGLNPAATFAQRMPSGQWRLLRELVAETGTGAKRFGGMLARCLAEHFPGAIVRAYADPSAAYGADKVAGEQTWIEIVEHEAQIRIDAAPTNALTPRLEAVRSPLVRLIDGQPGLLLCPEGCPKLRQGFNTGYRYRKQALTVEQYHDTPDKNEFSHPHDACQYALSGGGEDGEIAGRRERRERMQRQVGPEPAFNALDYAGPR